MRKLILVRYGEHSDGHLNAQGKETMGMVGEKLKHVIEGEQVLIACAKVARAEESGEVLASALNLPKPISYDEFYAAEEEGKFPNIDSAIEKINTLDKDIDTLIVIASREYIEQLPSNIFDSNIIEKVQLNRGEILVIDYEKQNFYKM